MHIDVFFDTVCPWCRIGEAHLKSAISTWTAQHAEPVTVAHHPYFLNPDIPAAGYPFRDYMHAKGGGQVPLEQWFAAPRDAGARAGLTFNFEQIKYAPNSTLSHQLIALAPEGDARVKLIDALYAAYFEFGRDIGDLAVLLEIARDHGIDVEAARAHLNDEQARTDVFEHAARAAELGIRGVPFFVVNNALAFSGAQPPEVILQVMEQSAARINPSA